ncbi:MAG: ABC-F family ATP-binding cassette domain-containing protein [Chloroflexi bacterium]|nr:ABC-F family ATP-binding cassette domain-containing protein [Chloroflexota bacterium]
MALLSATNLTLFYGNNQVFSGVDLEVSEGARIGIVGANGSGKTSLLRILVGEQETDGGTVHYARGVRIGYVPQTLALTSNGALYDEVMTAYDGLRRLEEEMAGHALDMQDYDPVVRRQAEARYAALAHQFEARGGYTFQSTMERVVSGLGLSPEALRTPVASASGGERTRAALAKALLADPDLLVLDEPTNHLDLAGITWLERFLGRSKHAFVVVSHDRYFLDAVADQIWELEEGKLQTFPGNYSKYRVLRAERDIQQQQQYERQQEHIAKEEEFIRRYGAGQRSQEAQGRAKRLEQLERLEAPRREEQASLATVTAARAAQVVIRTRDLKVGFTNGEERFPLLSVPDMNVNRGTRAAILGSNGAGKTTFITTLLGLIPPVEGSATLGGNVRVGYHQQGLGDIPEDATVLEALLEVNAMSSAEGRAYLARFLFRGQEAFQVVSTLSGGQRSRLALARLLVTRPNVLVLDEPTNHLDIPSREALEHVLLDYDGTLIFVSHDRQLIALLAQQLWIVGDGTVTIFPGGYQEWVQEQERKASPPPPPVAAKRPPPLRPVKRPSLPVVERNDNPELAIAELEEKLQEIEGQLQKAAELQDFVAVTRLGREHAVTLALLDKAWANWEG